jgi:aspartate racemase
MKKVGIVGGLGPESTIDYYQTIIKKYQDRLNSKEVLPELFINSINMYQVFEFISKGNLDGLTNYLVDAIKKLELVGSNFAVISANTPHIVFDVVKEKVNIPLYSIVEETYKKSQELNVQTIGLFGTKFTMENDFFQKPFKANNVKVVVPTEEEQVYLHQKIVAELENGIVNPDTKKQFIALANDMIKRDKIEALILGCTELPMILQDGDLPIPLLNTTDIHINKIVDTIFSDGE